MGVTIHHGTSFVVSDDLGDMSPEDAQGYFHLDTRFLSRHELRLDGRPPIVLQPTVPCANEGWHFLTNPQLAGARRSTLGMAIRRVVGGGLVERLEIENFAGEEATFELTVRFASDFAYILTVKQQAAGGETGWHPRVRSDVHGAEVRLELAGADPPHRTSIAFEPAPAQLRADEARFPVRLAPRERWTLLVEVAASIGDAWVAPRAPGREQLVAARRRRAALARDMPRVETDHPVLGRAFARAVRDLSSLRIKAEGAAGEDGGGGAYAIAAGIPWYMDLFGRDSLVASYQCVVYDPLLARGTLEALAALQGKKVDPVAEEAPGKILHEYRRGPLTPAARRLIPAYPYYGTIDATPLFLVTLSEYVRVTGDVDLARKLWPNVAAAVDWMRRFGDRDGDGLLEYELDSEYGLVNQGWKDSVDSVRFRDGAIARPPIALVEVQGYAYDARRRAAELARQLGRAGDGERLDDEAAALKRRIAERYWVPARSFFAEALDGSKSAVDSLTSNPGHLLWSGAVGEDHARAIARVLLSDEMFSGFGVRTMGEREGGYNPVSYHDGSVWPHDNSLILMGLVRYGLHDEAARLADALLRAIARFPGRQPPELFCGYSASRYDTPVRYPTACTPQAWAAGSVLLLVRALLGLEVDAAERRISLAPTPVPGMTRLDVSGVRAGSGTVDVQVRFEAGEARADVLGLPPGWRRAPPGERVR